MKQVNLRICRMILPLLFGLFLSLSAYAQQVSVKGHVKDSTGEPVIGANVVVKDNSSIGTITDLNGNFVLSVPQNSTLVISFIGYKPVEVKAAPSVTVTLQDDAVMLQEAVVIGYGTVKKNDVTGSVMAIDADKMVKGMATSASDLLVGKAAGVSVITDGGAPGAGATIRVRGGSSMSASNDPLIVIDGVPVDNTEIKGMGNPLSTVHPNDIETFTILKDASATAIYGSRASNGVIIITTKKGQSGRVKVDYSGTFSISTKSNTVDVMKADDFRNFVIEKFGENSLQANALGKTSTDWQDEIFRTAFSTDHNVSVSGAVPHMPYRVSVAYTNENGILKTSNMQRLTGAINLNPNFFDKKLNIQLNVKGVYNKNRFADRAAIGLATQYDPTQPVYMEGNPYGNGYFMYMKQEGDKISPIDIGLANPVAMLEEKDDKSTVYRSIGNAQIDYKFHFLPELRANLNLGYDVSKSKGDVIIADNSPLSYCTGNFKSGFGENSHYTQLKRNTLLDFYLNYTNTFGVNYIDVMAGYSWQHFYNSTTNSYPYSAAYAEKTGEEFYKKGDDYASESYLVSFFGRLNYTLLNRYLVTFTLRNDGSSRFSPDNRWGLFPSVALAWKLNEESFLKNVNAISDLKLRLGYGVTGQQNLGNGDYPYMARYMYSKAGANYYFGDTEYSLIAPQPYDQNLKWEETTTWNVGIDYGFLNGRITGTIDYYFRKTKDLLNTVTAPAGTNFSNQLLTNVGTLENKGFEFSLGYKNQIQQLKYNITFNGGYAKNKITYWDEAPGRPAYQQSTGKSIPSDPSNVDSDLYYETIGIFRDQAAIDAYPHWPGARPGDIIFKDVNEDGIIDANDRVRNDKTNIPRFTGGLNISLSYRQFDLSILFQGATGAVRYIRTESGEVGNFLKDFYDNRWTEENPDATGPRTFTDASEYWRNYDNTYFLHKTDYIRLKNIEFGYNLPLKANRKIGIQNLRFYISGYNLLTFSPDLKDFDPESSQINGQSYPVQRVINGGLTLTF